MSEFKDYYQILDLIYPSNAEDIKSAYRRQSLQWHPDKNPETDVTQKMQDINEAYAILKNAVKKARYDKEYLQFIHFKSSQSTTNSGIQYSHPNEHCNEKYDIHDKDLKNDINEACQYAHNLVEEFMRSLRKESSKAAVGVWEGTKGYVIAGVIFFVLGLLIRTCQ